MDPLHLAHLVVLATWGGLVLAEIVIEFSAADREGARRVAALHHRLDMVLELPLLAAVVGTGFALTLRAWPLTTLHWVKIAAGSSAVGANLYCVVHVVLRQRRANDPTALARHTRRVVASACVGVPFGLVAAYLGFAHFRA